MKKHQQTANPTNVSPASHYWASWDTLTAAPNIVRKDTRIYWKPQKSGTVGQCYGTFFGENPGGAQSIYGLGFNGYSPIENRRQSGDPTLRLIFDLWQCAMRLGRPQPNEDDYIEILNLYYFRNPETGKSLTLWRHAAGSALYQQSPAASSRFVLLGWGVGTTHLPEAQAAVSLLKPMSKVIIPDSSGKVRAISGSHLVHPVTPGPVQPSYVLKRSKALLPAYVANVAQQM